MLAKPWTWFLLHLWYSKNNIIIYDWVANHAVPTHTCGVKITDAFSQNTMEKIAFLCVKIRQWSSMLFEVKYW